MSDDVKYEFSGDINGEWRLRFSSSIEEYDRLFVNETDEQHIEKFVRLGKSMKTRIHLKQMAEEIRLMQMYLDAMGYKGEVGEA